MTLTMRFFTLITLFFTAFTSTDAQIKPVEKFLRENKDLQKYFIYQSTLRMLNDTGDPDFNKLIKGIRKINVYISEESSELAKGSYQRLIRELGDAQFETLVSAKQSQMVLNLMSRESGNEAYYILAAHEGNNFALLEMDGKLDLRYLKSLDNVNFLKLRKILGKEENSQPADGIRDE
jgi:hypothetical protein